MMRLRFILFQMLAVLTAFAAGAKGVVTPHRGEVAGAYDYWLYTPESAEAECAELVPLVIFLHGASLCGNDLNKVKRYGTIAAIERGMQLDAYVLAPQNNRGAWDPEKIMALVDHLIDTTGTIDTSRIYVLGLSLGGYGAIDLAATHPDRIAAAIGMAGGASVKDVSGLNDIPLWIIHGTADTAVSVSESDKVVARMRADEATTPRLVYSRVPGMNHGQPARLFYMPRTYRWLFSHSLEDMYREVSEPFDVSTDALRDAYRQDTGTLIAVPEEADFEKRSLEDEW